MSPYPFDCFTTPSKKFAKNLEDPPSPLPSRSFNYCASEMLIGG
jgi:hypothetical protein